MPTTHDDDPADFDDQIQALVARRLRSEQPRPEDGLIFLRDQIEGFPVPTDEHAVLWKPAAWSDPALDDDIRVRIDNLTRTLEKRNGLDGEHLWISRSDVFRQTDNLDVFLATMAWGYGTTGYGWRRTAAILSSSGSEKVATAVDALRDAYSRQGLEGVWRSWSVGGAAKLPGVNTAFASKIAYFTCFDDVNNRGPLIADKNTSWALWGLADIWDSRRTAAKYRAYIEWSEQQAKDLNCRCDDVERALFYLGPPIQKVWKRLQSSI